jgi:MFS family permease
VAHVVVHRTLSPEDLSDLLQPRQDFLAEQRLDGGGSSLPEGAVATFGLDEGPFHRWDRTVEVGPTSTSGTATTERVRFRLAIPGWSWLFGLGVRRSVRHRPRPGRMPWWAPPERLDTRTATVLGLLCAMTMVTGYVGTVLSQTNTFVREDFGASESDIGWLLGIVRVGALLVLVIVALADRYGRRRALAAASVLACLTSALSAFAPDLVWLGASQVVVRSFSMTTAVLAAVVAAEETPKRSRAWAVSVLLMAAALGAGLAVMLLPLTGVGAGGWRLLFLVPLLAVWPMVVAGRRLPETRRFAVARASASTTPAGDDDRARTPRRRLVGRLALLAGSALLLELFIAPSANFLNEYLRTEHGYTAGQIALFTILTNTPAGIGIVVGGRWADARGRRALGAFGLGAGTALTVATFLTGGLAMWAWSVLGSVLAGLAIPALAVYGPELFPTWFRARANGTINLFRVLGSFLGLVGAGLLADALAGGLPVAIALLGLGPAVVVVLVLVLYPETSNRSLEQINPEDAPFALGVLELEGLDPGGVPTRLRRPRSDDLDG